MLEVVGISAMPRLVPSRNLDGKTGILWVCVKERKAIMVSQQRSEGYECDVMIRLECDQE